MTFPITQTLTRTPHTGDSEDGLGNTAPTFGDPVDVGVFQVTPHITEHGSATSTETEHVDLDVYMPKTTVNAKDRFTVDGKTFEVISVRDWTQGFIDWEPGIVVELQRID